MTQTKIRSLQTTMPNADGWMLVVDTWAYASATTITVPSGAALLYAVGDKIRLKQGATYKYFYVIVVADTLLTVTGGSDYTVATPTAITDVYYSHVTSPVGFPQWFNWNSTCYGTSGSVGTYSELVTTSKFSIVGRSANIVVMKNINNLGSWSGNLYMPTPFHLISQHYLGGEVIANAMLTRKGVLHIYSDYMAFESLVASTFLGFADLSANDWVLVQTTVDI